MVFGLREPDDAKFEALSREPGIRLATVAEAAAAGEVVVLAMPWQAVPDVLAQAGDLTGKILVDCTNPLRMGAAGLELTLGYETSGAEQVAAQAPGARVCKAFNSTGYGNMEQPAYDGQRAVMFVCGDDAAACRTVGELSDALGFETILAGGLRTARLLEPLAMLWIQLAFTSPLGRDFAFALLRRNPQE